MPIRNEPTNHTMDTEQKPAEGNPEAATNAPAEGANTSEAAGGEAGAAPETGAPAENK